MGRSTAGERASSRRSAFLIARRTIVALAVAAAGVALPFTLLAPRPSQAAGNDRGVAPVPEPHNTAPKQTLAPPPPPPPTTTTTRRLPPGPGEFTQSQQKAASPPPPFTESMPCTCTTSGQQEPGTPKEPLSDAGAPPATPSTQPTATQLPPGPLPTLSVQVTGAGSVKSSPGGIDCPGDCAERLSGTVVLTAEPEPGFTFHGWGGGCSAATATCTLAVGSDSSVQVGFDPIPLPPTPKVRLSVQRTGDGTVISSPPGIRCGTACSADFDAGTIVSLGVSHPAGSAFAGWSRGCAGPWLPCTLQLERPTLVRARFMSGAQAAKPVDDAAFEGRWSQSRFLGALHLAGRVRSPSLLDVDLESVKEGRTVAAARRHALVRQHFSVRVAAGAFSKRVDVSGIGLLPGRYAVEIVARQTDGRQTSAGRTRGVLTLPAPAEGIVKTAYSSAARKGRPLARLRATADEVWVHFLFLKQPERALRIFVAWTGPNGKFVSPPVEKANLPIVSTFAKMNEGTLPRGSWTVKLTAGGKTVKVIRLRVG